MNLTGKTVIVTGASRGIGAAAAHAFAAEGAKVALVARSSAAIDALAAEIGDAAIALPCDVADYDAVAAMVAAVEDRLGPVDILVNNAGVIEPISHIATSDPAGWAGAIAINLTGVYNCVRATLPGMIARGGGSILGVSSGAAHSPIEAWSHYCASKAGAAMLTRMIDKENRDDGIRAIGLSPGTVATEMQREIKASGVNPVSKLEWSDHIPPEWPAKCLVWMCGPEADAHLGEELALRDEGLRRQLGLIA
ncbi:Dehydrogenase [Candidatus Rhodobacter oscarellae]|uniref:Dehydrogenase n=1 Tax=Candidatus Rhodobacter oscarellae TaxID=1675527 RepID=A0A0J9E909_9RHOB|nr:SDR family NAD(P)-dependent oxidoreductase [Candidatus Rhodobacter lobularis]KMW59280.1 Dehydrogenase [Candidatus Rhodobacter lobularis]